MQDPFSSQPTDDELKAREAGPGRVPSPPVGELPAGGARWPVPHFQSKVSVLNMGSRAYRWTHDEALRHSRQNALAILRDLVIRNALMVRWTPVVQLGWNLEASDPTSPQETEAVAKLTRVIERTPRLQDFFMSLLWGEWFGRQGVMQLLDWVAVHDEMWMVVRDHKPINGDSIVLRYSGDYGQLVNSSYEGATDLGDGRGYCHFYTPREREAVVIHTGAPEDRDFYEPELAGAIAGNSLRGDVYYHWFLKSNFQALLADFSERFSNGVWLTTYPTGNDEAKTDMGNAVTAYKNGQAIQLPVNDDGSGPFGVKILDVGTQNPQFLRDSIKEMEALIHEYLTFGSLNEVDLAVGGDGAGLVEDRISRGVKAVAVRLSETLTKEWIPVLAKYNCPGVPPPTFKFLLDHPNAGELVAYAKALTDWGYTPPVDEFVELCGLPQAAKGDTVYSKIQPLSPVPDGQPQGLPVAGQQQQPQPDPNQQPQPAPQQQPVQAPPPVTAPDPVQAQPSLLE